MRGPDVIWGGDIRTFHPPPGVFDGVIGGPPCQTFSPIGNVNKARYGEDCVMPDLIPQFTRVVEEASPGWWLMECSPYAYAPFADSHEFALDNCWFGEEQSRIRKFWSSLELHVKTPTFQHPSPVATVCSSGSVDWKGSRAKHPKRDLAEMLRLQGFPADLLDHQPWTMQAKRKMVGNGVSSYMGRALARAVRCSIETFEH